MKLHLVFQDESFTEIILLENDTVARWFKHFQKITADKNYYSPSLIKSSHWIRTPDATVGQHWTQIQSAMMELETLGYQIPWSIPEQFDRQQETLNRLHRLFTYNVLWYHELWNDPNQPNPFDPGFKLPSHMDFQQWLDLLDRINQSVHRLEDFTHPHKNKTWIQDQHPLSFVLFKPIKKSTTDLDPWLEFTHNDLQHNFNDYLAMESPMVTLDRSILGKCVLQSFYDNDDLNAQDCTGRLGSFGGFEIELDSTKKQIYRSQQFAQWAASHGKQAESLPLEFPIGYVKGLQPLLDKLHTFKKVEFVD
jgi:hypothetical protein